MKELADVLDQVAGLVVRNLADRRGLSMTALACLSRLRHEGPLRLTTLAAAEGVSQPSMSQLVQRLERHDLVSRVSDPDDGRATLVALTEPGRALLTERRDDRRKRLAALIATLTADDVAALRLSMSVALPLLRRLAETARETAAEVT
jgi:DNA-binding MarR family transcriptional regulator